MILWLGLLAALGCALCSGIAAVLQKISADKESVTNSINVGMFIRLLKDWPYLLGIILDLSSWVFTLIAVHSLPLFVVQPIIAFSVVVTALVESLIFHRKLGRLTVVSIGFIVFGLLLLGATATPETVTHVNIHLHFAILAFPLLLAVAGVLATRLASRWSAIILATISGLAFGADSVAGRVIVYGTPIWKFIYNPLLLAMIAYGIIGVIMLTIALQRTLASVVMAIILTSETIGAIGIGLLMLGDSPRHGLWHLMIVGAIVATVGSLIVALNKNNNN